MKTSDFNFLLPEELIARYPLANRTESRLLYLNEGDVSHRVFSELPDLLTDKDVLILNNTRVIPARLFAKKTTGGKVEILVERILDKHHAIAHVKATKSLKLPCILHLENDEIVTLYEREGHLFKAKFNSDIIAVLKQIGTMPLPNYMQRAAQDLDKERYQTVYATNEGAVAAPTAGLHFDSALFDQLAERKVKWGFITLHVGAGTFKPVTAENITDHDMHSEVFEISQQVCDLISICKERGGRVIAVGTTTVRALETVMQNKQRMEPYSGETNIFIYPGYRFRCIDALITNFHLPKSTLLMLVCAFGGYQEVMKSYEIAISERYRFYSYGDAMLVSCALAAHSNGFSIEQRNEV